MLRCYVHKTWRWLRTRQAPAGVQMLAFARWRRPARPGGPVRRGSCNHAPSGALPLLLDVLDVGEFDALGALLGVAEIELVPGEVDGIAIDVVGDAGGVRRDEGIELPAIVGRDPARELELAHLELDRQRVFGF